MNPGTQILGVRGGLEPLANPEPHKVGAYGHAPSVKIKHLCLSSPDAVRPIRTKLSMQNYTQMMAILFFAPCKLFCIRPIVVLLQTPGNLKGKWYYSGLIINPLLNLPN